ncbi:MAG TPA: TetR/AcrR family transcriptional regulator [Acidimicrobiales bacterium]|nr:TetR/AcrR family transcriptional regulator [Acidimicrobiales bacterium]
MEKRTKRQRQAAATQEQLLVAAREIFAERGYQAATVGAITSRANTAHGTFYLYFRNKQDAFVAVMASVTDELYREADLASPATDARQALEGAIRGFLEAFVRHRRLWRTLLEASFTSTDIEPVWLSLRGRFVDRIERDLRLLVDAGVVRRLDAPLVANALGGMVEWAATTQYVLGSPSTADRTVDETAAALADLWFAAVFADAPAPATT